MKVYLCHCAVVASLTKVCWCHCVVVVAGLVKVCKCHCVVLQVL